MDEAFQCGGRQMRCYDTISSVSALVHLKEVKHCCQTNIFEGMHWQYLQHRPAPALRVSNR